jgi:hypothetical protein
MHSAVAAIKETYFWTANIVYIIHGIKLKEIRQ